jgi:hypothetical protein
MQQHSKHAPLLLLRGGCIQAECGWLLLLLLFAAEAAA